MGSTTDKANSVPDCLYRIRNVSLAMTDVANHQKKCYMNGNNQTCYFVVTMAATISCTNKYTHRIAEKNGVKRVPEKLIAELDCCLINKENYFMLCHTNT